MRHRAGGSPASEECARAELLSLSAASLGLQDTSLQALTDHYFSNFAK